MPNDSDARGAGETEQSSTDDSPDLVGEELGDGARIWRLYDRVSLEDDRERIGNWNRGLNDLSLFAGLFSAVTTAFIIQLQQDTQPDYARLTFLVLNASNAGLPFRDEPFTIDHSVRTTNCLWIASLLLSLTAALIAIMGKDWIAIYAFRPVCNPRQWAEIRSYRVRCVERWYMSALIVSAPVLLHMSLLLFATGLVIFLAPDPFSQRVALGLALTSGGLYLVTVLSAVIFPTSPFKSPATQAVRSALGSIWTSLSGTLVYPSKRRPVTPLQQATPIIGTALSLPLPADILPLDQSQRRRLRRPDVSTVWNHLFSPRSSHQGRSWRHTAALLPRTFWTRLTRFASSFPAHLRSMVDDYRYRRQRPRTRPWHLSARSYLPQIALSDHWAEASSQPTPGLLALSLSHLHAMTQSTYVFHSILVALGDISIGREVAPLVSFDLKTRLATEMRHNWRRVDLVTLSRYLLADQHLSNSPVIPPHEVYDRFRGTDTAIKSESIVFALVGLEQRVTLGATVNRYFPDILTQPRALQYLLPGVNNYQVAIVLALHYWDQLSSDRSINLHRELRARVRYLRAWEDIEAKLNRRFGGRPDLLELLVFTLDYMELDMITLACTLILKFLDGTEHPCLVYAFGHNDRSIADAACAALPAFDPLASMQAYYSLAEALPLAQFAPWNWRKAVIPAVTEQKRAGGVCLTRIIVRLLCPSRYHWNIWINSFGQGRGAFVSRRELCVRCLHTRLHSQGWLNDYEYLEIVMLILDNSVLIGVTALSDSRLYPYRRQTAERNVINILTAIARRLTRLLTSNVTDNAARLFCLFSFSEAMNYRGDSVTWDLGSYLRTVPGRLSDLDPSTAISLRRLLRFLRTIRPLCAQRNDLRAAWERIGITPDDEYYDCFWDAEDFELRSSIPTSRGPKLRRGMPASRQFPLKTSARCIGLTQRCADTRWGLWEEGMGWLTGLRRLFGVGGAFIVRDYICTQNRTSKRIPASSSTRYGGTLVGAGGGEAMQRNVCIASTMSYRSLSVQSGPPKQATIQSQNGTRPVLPAGEPSRT